MNKEMLQKPSKAIAMVSAFIDSVRAQAAPPASLFPGRRTP